MKPMYPVSQNKNLPIKIVNYLKNKIEKNILKPGDKLPTEKQLCEQFTVSRSVIREAVSQLKSEGLVYSQQGRGVFVNERPLKSSFILEDTQLDDIQSLEQILELLLTIEGAAARLAALRHSADDLKQIQRALISMEYAILHDQLGDEEDFAFHQSIVNATHNPHFIALNEYLEQHVRKLIRRARRNTAQYHDNLIQHVQKEHQAIFQAIKARDPDKAVEAAETHLRNAAKRLNTYIQN